MSKTFFVPYMFRFTRTQSNFVFVSLCFLLLLQEINMINSININAAFFSAVLSNRCKKKQERSCAHFTCWLSESVANSVNMREMNAFVMWTGRVVDIGDLEQYSFRFGFSLFVRARASNRWNLSFFIFVAAVRKLDWLISSFLSVFANFRTFFFLLFHWIKGQLNEFRSDSS